MARINSRNTIAYLLDGADANVITAGPTPGDFSASNLLMQGNEENIEATNRGEHDGFADGASVRQELSFTVELNGKMTDPANANVYDWLRRGGIYDPVTGSIALTSADPCKWAFKVKIEAITCGLTTSITFPKFRPTSVTFTEGDTATTLAISGTNYVAPVYA